MWLEIITNLWQWPSFVVFACRFWLWFFWNVIIYVRPFGFFSPTIVALVVLKKIYIFFPEYIKVKKVKLIGRPLSSFFQFLLFKKVEARPPNPLLLFFLVSSPIQLSSWKPSLFLLGNLALASSCFDILRRAPYLSTMCTAPPFLSNLPLTEKRVN